MPFVPAKCTICGAILTINSDKDAAVCNSCGNAFVVEKAINNYNTYNSVVNNITSDNVIVHIESEKERLNTAAETYIKLGNMSKALNMYHELVDRFPNDWRGWWGSIYYYYDGGTIQNLYRAGKQAELEHQMELFKKIAPPEEYEKLEGVIEARIDEAKAAIEKDYLDRKAAIEKDHLDRLANLNATVENVISTHEIQIEELESKLSEARSKYNVTQPKLEQATKEIDAIEAKAKRISNRKEFLESIPMFGVLAWAVFCVLLVIDSVDFFLILIVGGLLGVGIWFVLWLLSMILVAVFIHFPVKELNSAKDKQSSIQKTVDDLSLLINNLEAKLNLYKSRTAYMKQNKDTLVASMDASSARAWGQQEICTFVDSAIKYA